ncbi:hypothetical protein A0J61_11683 [Choanephora cucurbitarum]|uniref:CCHC-type domain-containing protein n=1 Tax=Choanephora cucurbitarum TaxID=101091 RepID=A0A1C7MUY7_9FUNG|nr:hypothetical protein A0J61_11683 [Choanephora cucurbitarum]
MGERSFTPFELEEHESCADDHLKANCPKLNFRRKACFICGSYEHLRAKCSLLADNYQSLSI